MATRRNIEVVISVRDSASKPLNDVEKKLRNTGKAAKNAAVDFTQFNKTLFATTAFVGTFLKAFSAVKNSLDFGGDLDRLSTQYERVLGPKGRLFNAITSLTTTSIDRTDAMNAALKLGNMGLVKSADDAADIVAKAGTAAKMANVDVSKGIESLTDSLATGSLEGAHFLQVLAKGNPALKAQLEILHKTGGALSGTVSHLAKLAIIRKALDIATRGHLKDEKDLKDVTDGLGQSFKWLRGQIGIFLGAALGPLLAKLIPVIYKIADFIELNIKTNKQLVFLTKAVIIFTGAIVGLSGALGTLVLTTKLLAFAGIGLPGLTTALILVTGAFLGLTKSVDPILEKFKLFGAFVQGVWQLVSNLDDETGQSKIGENIKKQLENAGIYDFALNLARILSVVKVVTRDIYRSFVWLTGKLDDAFGNTFNTIFTFIGKIKKEWTTWWTSDAISPISRFVRTTTTLLATIATIFAGKKIFDIFGKVLTKLPIIGKFFGGGEGGKPDGTPGKPLHVKNVDGSLGGGLFAGAGLFGGIFGKFKDLFGLLFQGFKLGGIRQVLKDIPSAFALVFPRLTAAVAAAGPFLMNALIMAAPLLAAAIGALLGSLFVKGMDSLTGGKYSQVVGAPGAWLAEKTGALISDEDAFKQAEANFKKPQYTKTEAVVPKLPESQIEIVDALGEKLKTLEGNKKDKFKQNIEDALAASSAGGESITPEEWVTIFRTALDTSQNLSITADNSKTKKTDAAAGSSKYKF